MVGLLTRGISLLGFAAGVALVPHRLCKTDAECWYTGDVGTQEALAQGVDGWLRRGFGEKTFATGATLFDREWIFGTYQMAALGFGQVAHEHPDTATVNRERMERAIDGMLSPAGRAFDTVAWGHDALKSLDSSEGHAAFLGYANLVLSFHRSLFPDSKYAALNDAMTRALTRRFEAAPTGLIETYPGQTFPVDNTPGIASVALHARATNAPKPPVVARIVAAMRRRAVDSKSGLLFQRVRADGRAVDAPRGSGTALAAYFISFADADFSAELHRAVQRELATRVAGFRAIREYPSGHRGHGDIDSGPLVLGHSISATGFALAGCRIHRDPDCYREILATAELFGTPLQRKHEQTYVAGGPLGDAILFAMQTAQPRSP
jgi:hypothetical protein